MATKHEFPHAYEVTFHSEAHGTGRYIVAEYSPERAIAFLSLFGYLAAWEGDTDFSITAERVPCTILVPRDNEEISVTKKTRIESHDR